MDADVSTATATSGVIEDVRQAGKALFGGLLLCDR